MWIIHNGALAHITDITRGFLNEAVVEPQPRYPIQFLDLNPLFSTYGASKIFSIMQFKSRKF